MSGLPLAVPPVAARVQEVILVEAQRGEGDLRRNVLQVWSCAGVLLAEHDEIHPDPIWPACFARDEIAAGRRQAPEVHDVSKVALESAEILKRWDSQGVPAHRPQE
jgi:hypothetical protein